MSFVDAYVSRLNRYALGVEDVSGRFYASLPVSNGVSDYEEYYELTQAQFDQFRAEPDDALGFIEGCRRREHDDLLMQVPGWNRGTPV